MERAARRPWSRAVYQSCSGRREPSAQVTLAQSPAAQTSGALVLRASSTSTAPPFERVRAEPARQAVLGTTPLAATTRSAGTSSPTTTSAAGPAQDLLHFHPQADVDPVVVHVLGDELRGVPVQGQGEVPGFPYHPGGL